MSGAKSIPTFACRSAKSASARPTRTPAAPKPTNRSGSMIVPGPGATRISRARPGRACRPCVSPGSRPGATCKPPSPAPWGQAALPSAPGPAKPSRNCTTPAGASSRPRWNSRPSVRISGASSQGHRARTTCLRRRGGRQADCGAWAASLSARASPGPSPPNSSARKWPAAARSFRPTSITPNPSR